MAASKKLTIYKKPRTTARKKPEPPPDAPKKWGRGRPKKEDAEARAAAREEERKLKQEAAEERRKRGAESASNRTGRERASKRSLLIEDERKMPILERAFGTSGSDDEWFEVADAQQMIVHLGQFQMAGMLRRMESIGRVESRVVDNDGIHIVEYRCRSRS